MVRIAVGECDGKWFAVGYEERELIATAVDSSRERALAEVQRAIPPETPTEPLAEPDEFARATIEMLAALEAGNEERKQFALSHARLPDYLWRILTVASSIPIGYATTYGNIAAVAHSEARVVGHVMATNPLYPIVPCHRVVGGDLALVGYGGKTDAAALKRKLGRLRAEVRGYTDERRIATSEGELAVFPVEWVTLAAARSFADPSLQPELFGP